MKTKYCVYGWLDGASYDQHKPADIVVTVAAESQSRAEDIGQKRIEKKVGRCDVIDSRVAD